MLKAITRMFRGGAVGDDDQAASNEPAPAAAAVESAPAATPPPPSAAPAPLDEDQGRALYERWLAVQRELVTLEAEAFGESAAYEAALNEPVTIDDVDARVTRLTDLEQRVAALQKELSAKRHRYQLEDELLFPYRQRARGRAQEKQRQRIAELERQDEALKAEVATHLRAAEELERERQVLQRRTEPIAREIERIGLSASKTVRVNVPMAAMWKPPAEVLVRASSWRGFLERARKDGLESADIVVNELTGKIVNIVNRRSAETT